MMTEFVRKSNGEPVQAVQFLGSPPLVKGLDIPSYINARKMDGCRMAELEDKYVLLVNSHTQPFIAMAGDWVVYNQVGEFSVYLSEAFAEMFEEREGESWRSTREGKTVRFSRL